MLNTFGTTNTILLLIIGALFVALIFARQIAGVINYLLAFNSRSAGARVLQRRELVDVETAERFDHWQTVNGLRLAVISLILKF